MCFQIYRGLQIKLVILTEITLCPIFLSILFSSVHLINRIMVNHSLFYWFKSGYIEIKLQVTNAGETNLWFYPVIPLYEEAN